MSVRLSVLSTVLALAAGGAPLANAAFPAQHGPSHGKVGVANAKGAKPAAPQKSCHNLPCH